MKVPGHKHVVKPIQSKTGISSEIHETFSGIPRLPNVPLRRVLWSLLLEGVHGSLECSWVVLATGVLIVLAFGRSYEVGTIISQVLPGWVQG